MVGLALVVAVLGVAGVPGAAEAVESTLYVDRSAPNCSNSGPGSQAVPFCTIDRGTSVAVAGNTVQVAAGTYVEEADVDNSGTSTAPIVIRPAPGAVVTVTGKWHAFKVAARSWVTIQGFRVVDTTSDGIDVQDSASITVTGNEVLGSGAPNATDKAVGIVLENTTSSVVSNNVVHHNSDRGIYLIGSTGNTIVGNQSYQNAREYEREASGIHVYRSSSNTIVGNIVHDNEDSGINIYTSSLNNLVMDNVSYGNGDHGVDTYRSTGTRLVSNTIYHNVTSGLNAEGTSTGTTYMNNITVDNGINSPRTFGNIRVDATSVTGTTANDNLMFLSTPGVMAVWNDLQYSTLDALRTATGQESRGLQADPLWRNPAAGNFRLRGGSPAIDSANSGADGQPDTDLEGTARVDDPRTADTGVGPRTYDDRGAYEFVPTPNTPPTAVDDTATTSMHTPVAIPVLANDTDPDGDPLSLVTIGTPAHGTASANPDGTVTYTGGSGWSGSDSFTYTVADGQGGTAQATVSVTVTPDDPTNTPPVAADDQATTDEGAVTTVSVLANDSDPNGDALTVAGVGTPGHGTATANPNGSITYTPAAGYNGADQFGYSIKDGRGGTASATVSVTVVPRNFVGNVGFEAGTTGWNTAGSSAGVTLQRVAGGHSGDWAAQLSNTGSTAGSCNLNDAPNWVSTTAAGTYTVTMWVRADAPGADLNLRLREYSGATLVGSRSTRSPLTAAWTRVVLYYGAVAPGTSNLDLSAYTTGTAPGTCFYADDVSVTRTDGPPPNTQPDAVDDSASTAQDATVTIPVLANDQDADGDPLTVTSAGSPPHGSTVVNPGGTVSYTPAVGYAGPDQFTYTVSDGRGGSDTATVSVTVSATDPNLVGNAGFEGGTSGWNTGGSGTGVALARVAGGHSGGWAAQLSNASAAAATCVLNDSPNWVTVTSAGTYTVSMWVRADTAGAAFKLRLREYNGATLVGTVTGTATLSTTWQKVTATYVATAPGSSNLDLNGYVTSAAPGTCFYADDVNLTRS